VALVSAACVSLLVAGASGAVAALGDTLFPSARLSDALWADLSATSHLLIRLRILHPVLAIGAAVVVIASASRLSRSAGPPAARLARTLTVLVLVQAGLGLLNVILLAPVWLQLTHLLVADGIWIGIVLLGARALSDWSRAAAVVRAA
jgi:heme A synthase